MMNGNHPLKIVSLKVLEDWAMTLVDQLEPSGVEFDTEKPLYMSWVDIHGVMNGAVSVVAQKPFLQVLATNLLGCDEDTPCTDGDCTDAFKEMVNVLTGNFLTEAYGDDVVFDLLHPNVTEVTFADLGKFLGRKVVFAFNADGMPVAVTFSIQE